MAENTIYFWDGVNYVGAEWFRLDGRTYRAADVQVAEVQPVSVSRSIFLHSLLAVTFPVLAILAFLAATQGDSVAPFVPAYMWLGGSVFMVGAWFALALPMIRLAPVHTVTVRWLRGGPERTALASVDAEYAQTLSRAINLAVAGAPLPDEWWSIAPDFSADYPYPPLQGTLRYGDSTVQITDRQMRFGDRVLNRQTIQAVRMRIAEVDGSAVWAYGIFPLAFITMQIIVVIDAWLSWQIRIPLLTIAFLLLAAGIAWGFRSGSLDYTRFPRVCILAVRDGKGWRVVFASTDYVRSLAIHGAMRKLVGSGLPGLSILDRRA